jgi:hypothetical protein
MPRHRRAACTPSARRCGTLSLSDGGEMSDSVSLESLREQLRRMQLRLAESERCATSLSHEVGNINEQFATTLAHLQNEHAQDDAVA